MRTVGEGDIEALWNWGEEQRHEIQKTFRANLSAVMSAIEARLKSRSPIPPEQLARLADELQEAGETLQEAMSNCFAAAGFVHLSAAGSVEERRRRARRLAGLQNSIGKLVLLRRTSVPQLRGRHVLLEEVRGLKAIVRLGNDRWATPVDRVLPVDVLPVSEQEGTPASATTVQQVRLSPNETVTAKIVPAPDEDAEDGEG